MGVMIVEARPERLGRLAVMLRRVRDWLDEDNTHKQEDFPKTKPKEAYLAFFGKSDGTLYSDAQRKAILEKYGVTKKVETANDDEYWDDGVEDIVGNELSIVFDNHRNPQTIAGDRTVMVIPLKRDIYHLWGISPQQKPRQEDLEELGRYLLKRCR